MEDNYKSSINGASLISQNDDSYFEEQKLEINLDKKELF